ncbi:alpha/beta hydrolase family protein [Chitinophaga rhizophila]|uniref:Alpha/beta hydrolase n=1 Tax=Chitinophaga rhizophila TaxID=2866212 RepID=A0ABS7GB55_9BACT|nr:CocE/NonD family hydrolase [Chitinophaga rhizophila]MBW8684894.1 alpha/beta hydrolase [Chitinophaga rhizophila]
MLKYLIIICLSIAGTVNAQNINGNWYGVFTTPQGQKQRLQLQLQLQRTSDQFRGVMRSPDIAADSIALDTVYYKNGYLNFTINSISLKYSGNWNSIRNRFEGFLEQVGNKTVLNFSREEVTNLTVTRFQDPSPNPVYDVQEVKLVNTVDKVLLSGTFTKPGVKGPFPVIVLITGAGQQNRDNEMLDHRPFAVLTDYLVKRGIATLRLDDRGVGESTGNYDSSGIFNFAEDAKAAVSWLRKNKDADTAAIGLLGFAEGGAVAQIVAAGDSNIAFIINMASPGLEGREAYNRRLVQTAAAYGEKEAYIEGYVSSYQRYLNVLALTADPDERQRKAYSELAAIYDHFADSANIAGKKHFIETTYAVDTKAETLSLLQYDPAVWLSKIKCPVLAINGMEDLINDASSNLKGIENGVVKGGKGLVTVRAFPGLNHLFQRCNTCRTEEYGTLDETINPAVLEFITRWVHLLY